MRPFGPPADPSVPAITPTNSGEGTNEGGGGGGGDGGGAGAAAESNVFTAGSDDEIHYLPHAVAAAAASAPVSAVVGAVAGASASDEEGYGGAGSIAAAAALGGESGIGGCGSDSDVGSRMMSSSEVVELVGMFENSNRGEGSGGGVASSSSASDTGNAPDGVKAAPTNNSSQPKEGARDSGGQDT